MNEIIIFGKSISWSKWAKGLILFLLLSIIVVVFWQKTELSSSDLGRHIQNGKIVFSEPGVLFTNFYSYTEPGYGFVNHHWLSGLVYNILLSIGSFKLLTLFNILLAILTFTVFLILACRRSNFYTASILSLPVIFLLSERVEVRPEIFSYLFLGLTWLILEIKKYNFKKRLYFLVPIFILWANMHIYFFLGLALVAFYILERVIDKSKWEDFSNWDNLKGRIVYFKNEIILFLSLVVATLISPNHIKGLLYPLNIFREYGYQIAENKSIFFLDNLMLNHNFFLFKLLLLLLTLSLVSNFIIKKKKAWFDLFLGIFVSGLALILSRNLSLFALVSLVLIAPSAYEGVKVAINYVKKLSDRHNLFSYWKIFLTSVYVILLISVLIFFLTDLNKRQLFLSRDSGLGLTEGSLEVFEFYQNNELRGPIFNNYDSGSAIIYGLYNIEKVFVDNRPEAYSVPFFKDLYIPMQEDVATWDKAVKDYNINTIIFTHTDSTPWAKNFLRNISLDEKWSLVYFDRYYVVLVNNDKYDEETIQRLELNDISFRDGIRELAKTRDLSGKFSLANLAQAWRYDYLAKEIYQGIILKNPNNHRALFALAYIYADSSNRDDLIRALDYFEKGLKVAPRMPGIYNQKALVYWQMSDYLKAEENWKIAVRRGDNAAKDYLEQIEDLKNQGQLPR